MKRFPHQHNIPAMLLAISLVSCNPAPAMAAICASIRREVRR